VQVRVFDGAGNELTTGSLPKITLTPYDRPGPSGTQVTVSATGALSTFGPNTIAADTALPVSVGLTATLPRPFDSAKPRAADWKGPVPVFIRATADVTRVVAVSGAQTTKPDPVSSNRGTAGNSIEDGVVYVHGRLQVANAFGSELLRLPLRLSAQYWTGEAWENNTGDSISTIGKNVFFSSCQKNLIKAGGVLPQNCDTGVLKLDSDAATLDNGNATMWLKQPGAGHNGSAMVKMPDTPAWLPSTQGHVTFGVYKSPFIYIREVY
jgi:hypothetical protein